jgi:signal transduction histidine kinase
MNIQDKITYSIAVTLFVIIFITSLTFTQLFVISDRNNKLIDLAEQNHKLTEYISESYSRSIEKDPVKFLKKSGYLEDTGNILNSDIIIADSRSNILSNFSGLSEQEISLLLSSGNQINRFFTISSLFTLISSKDTGRMIYESIGNSKYYVSIRDLKLDESSFLSVFIRQQDEIALPPLRYMFNLLLIFLIAGLISIIAGVLLGRNISGPLLKLNKSVSRISDGDYSEKIRIKSSDEIGLLAKNINLMKNKIQKSHQSLKEFTYMLSHEIKNMLTSINGYAVGITEGVYSSRKEIDSALNIIKNKTKDLENITESLLMLSKIENKIIEISKEKIDLAEITDELVKFYEKELEDNRLTILKSYNLPENIEVLSDKYLIQTVISNLINNAVKYSSASSEINIDLASDRNYVIFSVSNTGQNIPDDEKNRIFNVFYRSKTIDVKSIKGFGLGLAISKKIATILEGELDFSSKNDKNTFIFSIPLN